MVLIKLYEVIYMKKEKKVIASVLLSASLLFGSFVIFNQDEIEADDVDNYDYHETIVTTTPASEVGTQLPQVMWDDWYDILVSAPTKKVYFIGEELNLEGLSVHNVWATPSCPNPKSGTDITERCNINTIDFDKTKRGIYTITLNSNSYGKKNKLSFDLEVIEKGDIDKNSNVSIIDLLKIKKNLLGIEIVENQNDICDLNRDGSLTSLDVVELINILLE